ncbi:MAG TPA: enoyl-CoA hydratase/isomerase family protein [Polyangiaceae bacterium]
MAPKAFTAELHAGVLELWLDTPNSDVNVFTEAAAVELLAILKELDFEQVRALVLRSRKRGSFVNGVGLLMASAARRPDDVTRLSAPVRRAFRALRALPIPTVCAIQGNCYGCGVELSLHTSQRVADRAFDTHFYMTELAEYLFLPVFGATQDLPALLGLESAVDFLMWGQRWTADEACRRGLIDACFAPEEFETELARFVEAVLTGTQRGAPAPRVPDPGALRAIDQRIAALPPDYRDLYAECFLLMQRALEGSDYAAELAASARSVLEPRSKAALSLFFVKQVAKSTALRNVTFEPVQHVAVCGDADLAQALRSRRIRKLVVSESSTQPANEADLTLFPYAQQPPVAAGAVAIARHDDIESSPRWTSSTIAYFPLPDGEFVEIAAREPTPERARAYDLFTRAGFDAIVSRPTAGFVSDALIGAYLAPLRRFLAHAGKPEDAGRTLRNFGFVKLPSELLRARRDALELPCSPGAEASSGQSVPALRGAVVISLLDCALESLGDGSLPHVSQLDVLARAVLDFPLLHASLGRYLNLHNVAAALREIEANGRDLVPERVLKRAEEYLRESRPFYR